VKSTTENLLLWEQRINERIKDGMTINEWCKKNEVSKHKYLYWNHRIREKQKTDKEMTFAEITPILSNSNDKISNAANSADFQIIFKNMQVTVPTNFNPVSLAGLMRVLQEL
jgi:hypothetical protein